MPNSTFSNGDKISTIPATATCTTLANVPVPPSTYDSSPALPKAAWETSKPTVRPHTDSKQPTGASNETKCFTGSATDDLQMKAPINKDLLKAKTTTNTTSTTTTTTAATSTTTTPFTPPITAIVPVTSSNKLYGSHPSSPSVSPSTPPTTAIVPVTSSNKLYRSHPSFSSMSPSTPSTIAVVPVTSSNKLNSNHPSSSSMSRRSKSQSLDGKNTISYITQLVAN